MLDWSITIWAKATQTQCLLQNVSFTAFYFILFLNLCQLSLQSKSFIIINSAFFYYRQTHCFELERDNSLSNHLCCTQKNRELRFYYLNFFLQFWIYHRNKRFETSIWTFAKNGILFFFVEKNNLLDFL